MLSRTGLHSALFLLAAGSASAAYAGNDWSGLYLGVNAGGAWGTADEYYPFGATGTPIKIDVDGFVYGAHAGYQLQRDSMVVGVEFSFGDTTLDGAGTVAPSFISCRDGVVVCRVTDVESLTTLGARLGFASDQWLFTASGGFAGADISSDVVIVATGLPSVDDSVWHNGWYLGAGAEYAMTANWSAGLEYIHVDLGEQRHGDVYAAGNRRDIDFEMEVVRARLTYNFGG